MKNLLPYIFLLTCTTAFSQSPKMYLYQVDALDKILKENAHLMDVPDTIRVAKGEHASVQIVIKTVSEIKDLSAKASVGNGKTTLQATTGFVGYVKSSRKYSNQSKDIIHSPSGYFPDPIYTDSTVNLIPGEIQPIWASIPIPINAEAGVYKGEVIISGKVNNAKIVNRKPFVVKVYPVAVNTTSLWITNWVNVLPSVLSYMNSGKKVEAYSPLYWELIERIARTTAKYGQNMYLINPVWLTQYTLDEKGNYNFNFDRLDKMIAVFEKHGAMKRIEGGHLAWRSGEWADPFFVAVPINNSTDKDLEAPGMELQIQKTKLVKLPIDDSRSQNFLKQFLPALQQHLQRIKWSEKYVQHIADEPVNSNAPSYNAITDYVKKYFKNVKIMDAVTASTTIKNSVNIWIPRLNLFHKEYSFFKQLPTDENEIWMYTCQTPRENYANRFIELPLIQTRLLHWINYKYNATGYLHWGLNYWGTFALPVTETTRHNGLLPGGDCFIVYPGHQKIFSSIRLEAMRDGIFDYELLSMLKKKNPAKATALVNEIIQDFDKYDNDISYFRKTRKEVLDLLSHN